MSEISKQQRIDAITDVIARAGGIVQFCSIVGISHQAVYSWKRRGAVPPDKALVIETLFGTPREMLLKPQLLALMEPAQTAADVI